MAYKLEITPMAQRDLAKLDRPMLKAVHQRVLRLAETADQIVHLPLKGRFAGLYKLRVRKDWRVIYDLQRDNELIVIVRVGHRREVYDE